MQLYNDEHHPYMKMETTSEVEAAIEELSEKSSALLKAFERAYYAFITDAKLRDYENAERITQLKGHAADLDRAMKTAKENAEEPAMSEDLSEVIATQEKYSRLECAYNATLRQIKLCEARATRSDELYSEVVSAFDALNGFGPHFNIRRTALERLAEEQLKKWERIRDELRWMSFSTYNSDKRIEKVRDIFSGKAV